MYANDRRGGRRRLQRRLTAERTRRRRVHGNLAWQAQFGCPLDELLGKTNGEIFPHETAVVFEASDEADRQCGEVSGGEGFRTSAVHMEMSSAAKQLLAAGERRCASPIGVHLCSSEVSPAGLSFNCLSSSISLLTLSLTAAIVTAMRKLIGSLVAGLSVVVTWAAEPVPDFKLMDVNPNSVRHDTLVSPRDYGLQVCGFYFGAAH